MLYNEFIHLNLKQKNSGLFYFIFLLLVLSWILITLNDYLIFSLSFLPIIILYVRYNFTIILFISLVLLLTMTSSLGEDIRIIVQFFSIGVLSLVFIYRFGFKFSQYPKIPSQLSFFLLFYYSSMIISLTVSEYQHIGILHLTRISTFFLVAYFIYSLIQNYNSIKLILLVLFSVSSIISLSILYELALDNFNFLDFGMSMYFRSGGLIPNVNAAAGLFAITFPLTIVLLFGKFNQKIKNILKVFAFLILIGIILTNSRAAYISLFVSISFIMFNLKRKYFNKLVIGSGLLAILFLTVPILTEFITLFLRVQDGISYREYLWKLSIDIINHNLFFGVGPGAYGQVMFKYFPVMLDSWQGIVFINLFDVTNAGNVSHNFYLGFFAELGIFGLITSLMLPIIFFRISFLTVKSLNNIKDNYYLLTIGITSIGLGLFTRANLDNVSILTNGYLTTDLPFWMVFGILIFLFLQGKNQEEFSNKLLNLN